jgi:2-oxoglutarate dehydrogenase E1 component
MTIPEALNLNYLDDQYQKYRRDPQSVSQDWRSFFYGFDLGLQRSEAAPAEPGRPVDGDIRVAEVIHRFRDLGHLLACMDPLTACPSDHPLLALEAFGLTSEDLARSFVAPQLGYAHPVLLKEIISHLKETYCRSVGVEYMHLQDPDERRWLQERMEPVRNQPVLTDQVRRMLLERLTRAAVFEQFLNRKYVAVTRFSLEGGDGLIPMLDTLLMRLADFGAREIILGMAHRGRLNVQANILSRPVEEILSEFESCYDSSQMVGSGDVKYHNGYLADIDLDDGRSLRVLLVNNPSHLEAVSPVVEGIARARQEQGGLDDHQRVVPVLLHGDAAFAGQGIVAETLNMSQLEGYSTGGTIHIVINNQIGYTTAPADARSTRYSTDVAKMLMVPIFHVHGENPEALAHVITLAADYRHTFGKDVVVDLICYRRYGHNEGDEPYFTQPQMYDRINTRPSPHQIYATQLIDQGLITPQTAVEMEAKARQPLETAYETVHGSECPFPQVRFFEEWEPYHTPYSFAAVSTALPAAQLRDLAQELNTWPADFEPHPKIKMLLSRRLEAVEKNEGLDWANAENLAFASLLAQGIPVRLSGQDSGRGTFSQRHSVLYERHSGTAYVPLQHLTKARAPFNVYNSLLAEAGVLGFEYGYAMTDPKTLTLWEAQFGDFANNAQGIIDLFIASGESKWQRPCGLVLLLPHGWEGLGPEHSSARLERYLQLCADDNLQVCDPTTPAQYFHLLRRQALAPFRKPLVVMTPKSLLRLPRAVSSLAQLSTGEFSPVLDDAYGFRDARRVLICSGKIYYQLLQRRDQLATQRIAILRLEQFYPFPGEQLQEVLSTYAKAKEWLWVQEAPENMGAWQFVRPRIEPLIGRPLGYVGRPAAASPATGFPRIYKQQQEAISDQAVGPGNGHGAAG